MGWKTGIIDMMKSVDEMIRPKLPNEEWPYSSIAQVVLVLSLYRSSIISYLSVLIDFTG